MMELEQKSKSRKRKIRYAVVGLGYYAQKAALPAFEHARNSELVALVSGNDEKIDERKFINIRCITKYQICKIRSCQGIFPIGYVILDILQLQRMNGINFRVVKLVLNGSPTG